MKTLIRKSIGALLFAGGLVAANPAFSQNAEVTEITTTTTTSSEGVVSEFGPQSFVIKTDAGTEPLRYSYGETTKYVDEDGNSVSVTGVKTGQPVKVFYTRDGRTLIASTVMVKKQVSQPAGTVETTQTTTTSQGIVTEFGPERIILNAGVLAKPVTYTHSKTTTYVDEDGNPVSIETVKSGLPVTVYSTNLGDQLTATRVMVRKAPVLEEKRTTTTTTTTTPPQP